LAGSAEEGRQVCGFSDDKPMFLVMGGSLGAVRINTVLREALPRLLERYNVGHICGKGNRGEEVPSYRQFEYVDEELPHLFAAADLFVGRSGATTLFELLALKKPSLLIPLATGASRGDQIDNAQSFERQGLCLVLKQSRLTADTLENGIDEVYKRRMEIAHAMEQSAPPDGVTAVIGEIEALCKENE
jgi:UDP-N-acetylglucosamine--N-acetylmuramyl-(pentapeptide) pyrophosphoryl-undecaprenol N-acetylglucosamine transferase